MASTQKDQKERTVQETNYEEDIEQSYQELGKSSESYHQLRMQRESGINRARRHLSDDLGARVVRFEERLSKFLQQQQTGSYVRRRTE